MYIYTLSCWISENGGPTWAGRGTHDAATHHINIQARTWSWCDDNILCYPVVTSDILCYDTIIIQLTQSPTNLRVYAVCHHVLSHSFTIFTVHFMVLPCIYRMVCRYKYGIRGWLLRIMRLIMRLKINLQ